MARGDGIAENQHYVPKVLLRGFLVGIRGTVYVFPAPAANNVINWYTVPGIRWRTGGSGRSTHVIPTASIPANGVRGAAGGLLRWSEPRGGR